MSDVGAIRRCAFCAALLPPTAYCDGEALPDEALAQLVMVKCEFTHGGRKRHCVLPRLCLERYRGADGVVRFEEVPNEQST